MIPCDIHMYHAKYGKRCPFWETDSRGCDSCIKWVPDHKLERLTTRELNTLIKFLEKKRAERSL